MKQLYIFIILILLGFQGITQGNRPHLKIGGFGGYAIYSFENLENANKDVISQLPFDAAVIDNFPSQIYFGGHVLIKVASWYFIGPKYEFHSTGSRVGAKDYSGSYHFDQVLSTHQLGIENEVRISNGLKPAVYISLAGGVNFSTWNMEEVLEVAEEIQDDNSEFVAIKPFVYPALKMSYTAHKNISIFGRVGYLFDLGGKYHLSENKDYKSTQKIPWSGFRISLGLEFDIDS